LAVLTELRAAWAGQAGFGRQRYHVFPWSKFAWQAATVLEVAPERCPSTVT
jgi:hypothetical protein